MRVPGGFFSPLFGLSFYSTGSLRFALAKCYKCFDNLVSDPRGSPRRARGYNGFTPRDLTKQHEDEYIHTRIHSPDAYFRVAGLLRKASQLADCVHSASVTKLVGTKKMSRSLA